MRRRFLGVAILLSLVLAIAAVYWPVSTYEFINFDDNVYVTDNPLVWEGVTLRGLYHAFTDTHVGLWIPLTWLSFMAEAEIFGVVPGWFHTTNALLHVLNAVLLFVLLNRMTQRRLESAFVAALFALHPLHVESVAWVTERKDVLSTLFLFLSLMAYLRYCKHRNLSNYLTIVVLSALSLMAKPMYVTLPLLLLLLDFWPLQRMTALTGGYERETRAKIDGERFEEPPDSVTPAEAGVQKSSKDLDSGFHRNDGGDGFQGPRSIEPPPPGSMGMLIAEKILFFVICGVVCVLTILAKIKDGDLTPLQVLPLTTRIANALVSYVLYLKKLLWPSGLAVFYPHPGLALSYWAVGCSALLLVAISVWVIRERKNHPYLLWGWAWFLISLFPVIGLAQAGPQAMADRFTYVPLIGPFVMIAWGFPNFLARIPYRRHALAGMALAAILACGVMSWIQVRYWKDSIGIFSRTVEVTSRNFLAEYNLAMAYMEKARLDDAIRHYRRAVEINPNHSTVQSNFGIALARKGQFKEAVEHYRKAIQIEPNNWKAHKNLEEALRRIKAASP
jgi:protein O-mannosyl-transferase